LGFALLLATAWGALAHGQEAAGELPPLPSPVLEDLIKDPAAWARFREDYARTHPATAQARAPATSTEWFPFDEMLPGNPNAARKNCRVDGCASNPLLLTDGTVIVHVSCTADWYKLTPTLNGSYRHGTWSPIASLPNGYAPRFFASAVLPDGRVIVEGGEYDNGCTQVQTNLGAIYDPVADTWTPVNPPVGWATIGDASSTLLANGRFLLSNSQNRDTALLDASKLTWTDTGAGKFDSNNEENWTLLPNGNVLTVDAYNDLRPTCASRSEAYVPSSGRWVAGGNTLVLLSGCTGSIKNYEAPTQILRPNGTVVAFGATASIAAHNTPVRSAIYNTGTLQWSKGPNLPTVGGVNYTMADAPAAVLPDGTVLVAASPGVWANDASFPRPTHFFVFDGAKFAPVDDITDSARLASYEVNFLVLPTGAVLAVETDLPGLQVFEPVITPNASYAPVITSLSATTLVSSGTYSVTGRQMSGLTYGAVLGDDAQANTNFPLVRITNKKSGHVFYARTHDFTSASVKPNEVSSTQFTLSEKTEAGASSLVVATNGLASQPRNVTIVFPEVAITPASCEHFPYTGGSQGYSVSVKNPPPGVELLYEWNFVYGNDFHFTLLDPGATKFTAFNPPLYAGPSKAATVKISALPHSGDGDGNVLMTALWYSPPNGSPKNPNPRLAWQNLLVNIDGAQQVIDVASAPIVVGAATCSNP